MVIAIIHVVGALGASLALALFLLYLGAWEQERVEKRRLQDASMALGVPVASIKSDESLAPRLLEYSTQRVSSELLRNRLSDLCGVIRTAWGWLGFLTQIGIFIAVCSLIYSDGAESAALMWLVVLAAFCFWLSSVVFSFSCLVLTGRYPGEAKAARKAIAAFIEQQNLATQSTASASAERAW